MMMMIMKTPGSQVDSPVTEGKQEEERPSFVFWGCFAATQHARP